MKTRKLKKDKEYPKVAYLEGAVMENGEFLHFGKSMGYINKRQVELLENGACKLTRGNEPVIALGEHVA